jgi:histidinol phosphatase-like PHP family hydrolase
MAALDASAVATLLVELGCNFSINPDAHATGEIASSTRRGLAIARKSGMTADRVINALDRDQFVCWLRMRKERITPRRVGARKRLPQPA